MNKKILAILALLIVATSITAVSAFDLGDLFGGAKNETVKIDGVDFNIPAGFKEDTSNTLDKVLEPLKKEGAQISSKAYTKDNDAVALSVVNVTNGLTNNQALKLMGGNKTTINNVNGYLSKDGDVSLFNFEKNNHVVVISSTDEKLIGDFLIA
ncbi:hypothetical protein [Methanobrevibacter sp.]|uniref:hypothetical protein n=1 Tax=Methanobrevibacter sp. TaxID=66852 RepID=UPI002E778EDA|nr:hypothetical protein [Methanobrevibacter sp.]MEE1336153.1 hypothetical protein [Methanobrevibacter sp.]